MPDDSNASVRYYVALWCAPLLFCLGLSNQVYHVVHNDLSVWKGGGMGMFSSMDHPSKRSLFLYAVDSTGERTRLSVDDAELTRLLDQVRILPSDTHIQHLFSVLSLEHWRVEQLHETEVLIRRGSPSTSYKSLTAERFELEMYKMTDIDHHANKLQVEQVQLWSS